MRSATSMPFKLFYLLVTVFSTAPFYSSAAFVEYKLSELWRRRTQEDVHLFPTHSSFTYPTFVGLPQETGVSRVHMTAEDVKKLAAELSESEIMSTCSYEYLGSTFYVVNTAKSTDDEVQVSLNLTLPELEAMTEEMIIRSMKPSHICRGSNGLHQAVWRGGSNKYLRHYIVQEGEIKAILHEDVIYGRRGYYPTSMQIRSSELPSLSISVHRRGQTILSISYGYSDLRLESKASPKNKYRVASISKTITAMGIAELVNRRHISLDSKVFGAKGEDL
ncbi:unnamed protein product [Haemonchus placei]|uniref:Beta-lactamase domain-containing protein n=1 Tax=Haemonchus placei TaxID=6290 RepID=A0A0N4W351_HAEPC|nr:unnamed protein product [Haemonchus placei]